MLRFLPVILLVQIVTAILLWVNQDAPARDLAILFGVPAILITIVTALWFASIARGDVERANAKLQLEHAREREKLNVKAEKSKARIMEQTQKQIKKQEKRVNRKAGIKVGLAFIGTTAAGVLMLITELFTFGLMTIMTTVGGLGGYLVRARQSLGINNEDQTDLIDVSKPKAKLPAPSKPAPSKLK